MGRRVRPLGSTFSGASYLRLGFCLRSGGFGDWIWSQNGTSLLFGPPPFFFSNIKKFHFHLLLRCGHMSLPSKGLVSKAVNLGILGFCGVHFGHFVRGLEFFFIIVCYLSFVRPAAPYFDLLIWLFILFL